MLKEFEFFHGVVFARILHGGNASVDIKSYPTPDNASYVVNDNAGIYIKYSSKRMSPWRFSFQKEHQEEILEMKNKLGEVYTVLVCNDDGIVCLSFDELKESIEKNLGKTSFVENLDEVNIRFILSYFKTTCKYEKVEFERKISFQ